MVAAGLYGLDSAKLAEIRKKLAVDASDLKAALSTAEVKEVRRTCAEARGGGWEKVERGEDRPKGPCGRTDKRSPPPPPPVFHQNMSVK